MAPETPRFVIVDAHSHALRAYHALAPMNAPDGLPTHAIFGLAGLLHRLVFEDRPDYLAIVFDAPDDSRTTFRSELYPAYKANRSARPADLTAQMPYLRDLARAFGLTPLEHAGFEADDLVAALTSQAEPLGLQTTILSADKDLMQLVSERTTLWDSMRGRRYTPQTVKEKLGVMPCAVADYLALVGDSSDNVPGVPGIGPKSAARLLEQHGDLDGIFAHLDSIPPRERTRLETCRELAYLSRSLTRLAPHAPLPCPFESFSHGSPEVPPLADLFARLGFKAFSLPTARPKVAPRTPAPIAHTLALEPTPEPEPTPVALEPTPAPAPAPAAPTFAPEPEPVPEPPKPTRRLRPSPSELARLFADLDPSQVIGLELIVHDDILELSLADLTIEVALRAPQPPQKKQPRRGVQPGLFDAPTPLSGPELASLLVRHLGPDAAHVPLTRGHAKEPALAALARWGSA